MEDWIGWPAGKPKDGLVKEWFGWEFPDDGLVGFLEIISC